MLQKNANAKTYLAYTEVFFVMTLLVFSWYFFFGKTFIYDGDAWKQHFKALVYFAEHVREVIRNIIFERKPDIPMWDFSIGEGADVLQTLHFYVIGDPFNLFAFLVPTRFLWVYYDFMILFRLYLSGIFFLKLCCHMYCTDRMALVLGALSYVFSGWCLIETAKHPFFLNPVVFAPLIVLGLEKILSDERGSLLSCAVMAAAISQFYFFYIIVCMTIVYTVVRLGWIWYECKDFKKISGYLLKISACSILGVSMASVIFLPMANTFLGDARMSQAVVLPAHYSISFYRDFFYRILLVDQSMDANFTHMAYSIPAFFCLVFLFLFLSGHAVIKTLFILYMLFGTIPFFGFVFNGLAYPTNRWIWAQGLLMAYMLVRVWEDLVRIKRKQFIILFLCFSVYSACCIFLSTDVSAKILISPMLCLGFLFLWCLYVFGGTESRWRNRRILSMCSLLVVCAGICLNSAYYSSPLGSNRAAFCKNYEEAADIHNNQAKEISLINDGMDTKNGFYRYSGDELEENAGFLEGISSTQYYWSLSNPYVSRFRRDMELTDDKLHHFNGYEGNAILNALAGVKYYISASGGVGVPDGFEKITDSVYRNRKCLPIAYSYKEYMPVEKWKKLSVPEKQEALLHAAVLPECDGIPETAYTSECRKSPFTIKTGRGISWIHDREFQVNRPGARLWLVFKGMPDCETFLHIKGLTIDLDGEESEVTHIAANVNGGEKKTITYFFSGRNYRGDSDYSLGFGYSGEPKKRMMITFNRRGRYRFDGITVWCRPMNVYRDAMAERAAHSYDSFDLGVNTIDFDELYVDSNEVLCMAVPYSKGWRATMDGKAAEVFPVNEMYLGLKLPKGRHEIHLSYQTPLLKEGFLISAISWLIFIGYLCCGSRIGTVLKR